MNLKLTSIVIAQPVWLINACWQVKGQSLVLHNLPTTLMFLYSSHLLCISVFLLSQQHMHTFSLPFCFQSHVCPLVCRNMPANIQAQTGLCGVLWFLCEQMVSEPSVRSVLTVCSYCEGPQFFLSLLIHTHLCCQMLFGFVWLRLVSSRLLCNFA